MTLTSIVTSMRVINYHLIISRQPPTRHGSVTNRRREQTVGSAFRWANEKRQHHLREGGALKPRPQGPEKSLTARRTTSSVELGTQAVRAEFHASITHSSRESDTRARLSTPTAASTPVESPNPPVAALMASRSVDTYTGWSCNLAS